MTRAQGPYPAEVAAGNARLERELQKAGMERDILKKAALIFGKGPPPGTSLRDALPGSG